FEEVRLHRAIRVERSAIANPRQVELAEVRGLQVNAPPDFCPEQAKVPANERRARQCAHKKRLSQMFVQGVEQFIPPNEGAPEWTFAGTISPDQKPFRGDGNRRCGQSARQIERWKKKQGFP